MTKKQQSCWHLYTSNVSYNYDKYLVDSKIFKIGIAFGEQVLKKSIIPTTENDIKMLPKGEKLVKLLAKLHWIG